MTQAAPDPRARTRTRTRQMLGLPPAPLSGNRRGGFVDAIEGATEDGLVDLAPRTHIDTIVQRYTGRAVPLDKVFPNPPPPETDDPLLERPVRAAAGRFVVAPREPSRMHATVLSEEAYRKEHQLRTMHRLILRKASTAQMAQALDVSLQEAYKLRDELFRRVRAEGGSIDMLTHSGMTIGFYDEVRATALRNMDMNGTTHTDKARYLSIAIGAENSKHRFLQVAGFYDTAKLNPLEQSDITDDGASLLQNALRALFDPDAAEDDMDALMEGDGGSGPDSASDYVRVL